METILHDLSLTAPVGGTILLGLIVVLINAFIEESEPIQYYVSLLGIGVNMFLACWAYPVRALAFNQMIIAGGYASVFAMVFLTASALTIILARDYIRKIGVPFGEFYILIILACSGMMVFASSVDLIATFLGLEIMSVSLYILAGFTRRMQRSNEASLKYFLLGAFATGFFLYGIALMYGSTGTTNLLEMAKHLDTLLASRMFLLGMVLLLTGFAFKIGAVPFHQWVPDVYQGSPTIVTAFMSTGAKASAFAAMALVLSMTLNAAQSKLGIVIAVLATASMVVGNVIALSQSNVKRMLAYSSIAHAGYMLIGIATGTAEAIQGVMFYLVSYMFTTIGAFGIVSLLESGDQENVDIASFNGLGTRRPVLGVFMSIFLFSLIGLPPLSGFFGKYYIFYAAITHGYTWLTIVGVVTSMISLYYYLRIVVAMYFTKEDSTQPVTVTAAGAVALTLSVIGVILIGLLPRIVLDWIAPLF
jgi:NADH-quinone oxidoreductase subunit N